MNTFKDNLGVVKVKCECGKIVKESSMDAHIKSRKHLIFLNFPNRIVVNHQKIKVSFE